MTEEEAFETIKRHLIEIFEIEPGAINHEARLVEDLELDSIDAVDMMVQLQEETGKKVSPEQFEQAKTVGDLAKLVCELTAS